MYVNHTKMFDSYFQNFPLGFLLSMLYSVPMPKCSICVSRLSLLTGKICTCGHKKVALASHYRVVSELRLNI